MYLNDAQPAFLNTSHVGSEGICRLNQSLSLLNKQEGLANISKHLRLLFTLWCSQRERQKDGVMGSNSSAALRKKTIAEFYKLIVVWGSDTALRHLLTAYHQCTKVMTKHQRQHSTASGYHTLVIMSLPLSPFKNQTFQVWPSLIYSHVYT